MKGTLLCSVILYSFFCATSTCAQYAKDAYPNSVAGRMQYVKDINVASKEVCRKYGIAECQKMSLEGKNKDILKHYDCSYKSKDVALTDQVLGRKKFREMGFNKYVMTNGKQSWNFDLNK